MIVGRLVGLRDRLHVTSAKLERVNKIVGDMVSVSDENNGNPKIVVVFAEDYIQVLCSGAVDNIVSSSASDEGREVRLSDITPTLASLTGVPIPRNSLGVLLPHVLRSCGGARSLEEFLTENYRQLRASCCNSFVSEPDPRAEKGSAVDALLRLRGKIEHACYEDSKGSTVESKICIMVYVALLLVLAIFLFLAHQLKSFAHLQDFQHILGNKPLILLTGMLLVTWKFNNYSVLLLEVTCATLHLLYTSVSCLRRNRWLELFVDSPGRVFRTVVRIMLFLVILYALAQCRDGAKAFPALKYALTSVAFYVLIERAKVEGLGLRSILSLVAFTGLLQVTGGVFVVGIQRVKFVGRDDVWILLIQIMVLGKMFAVSGKARCRKPFIVIHVVSLVLETVCVATKGRQFAHLGELMYFFVVIHGMLLLFCSTRPEAFIFRKVDEAQGYNPGEMKNYRSYAMVFFYAQILGVCYLNINDAHPSCFVIYGALYLTYKSIAGSKSNLQTDSIFAVLGILLLLALMGQQYTEKDAERYIAFRGKISENAIEHLGLAAYLTMPQTVGFVVAALSVLEDSTVDTRVRNRDGMWKVETPSICLNHTVTCIEKGGRSPKKEIKSSEELVKESNTRTTKGLMMCVAMMAAKTAFARVPLMFRRMAVDSEGYRIWLETCSMQTWLVIAGVAIVYMAQ